MYNTPEKQPFYNKRLLLLGLTLTICLQLMVLTTEFVSSVWPLWFGKPILLKTVPVDPRSLFRGNYVLLNYEISVLDKALSQTPLKKAKLFTLRLNSPTMDTKQSTSIITNLTTQFLLEAV